MFAEGDKDIGRSRKEGIERKWQRRAGNRSYLHEVGKVAGWGYPPLGREFLL